MPPQEPHTLVRVKLRSLLAITAGLAVVFAVASPFIRQLENERKIQLGLLMVGVGLGVCLTLLLLRKIEKIGGLLLARKLAKIFEKSGPLLLELTISIKSLKWRLKWFWLLVVSMASMSIWLMFNTIIHYPGTYQFMFTVMYTACISAIYTTWVMHLWTEGNNRTAKLCENGIILQDRKFYAWDSLDLRSLDWGQVEGWLVINISRAVFAVFVPEAQRDEVNAILEKYYWSKKASTKEPVEGVSSRITSSEGWHRLPPSQSQEGDCYRSKLNVRPK